MTPAKMFDGDLWVLAADATKMAENAYKKGQADEREACAKLCDRVVGGKDPGDIHSDSQWAALTLATEIRARGQQ